MSSNGSAFSIAKKISILASKLSKNFTQVLLFALLGTTFTVNANGTGGVIYLMQNIQHKKIDNRDILPSVPSDGFIFANQYYRSGADFFVCNGIRSNQGKVVAMDKGCSVQIKGKAPWYSISSISYTYKQMGSGLSLQQYLDKVIGQGLTKPVSVGLNRNELVVFYKKNKNSITNN